MAAFPSAKPAKAHKNPDRRFGPAWLNKHGYINLDDSIVNSLEPDFWEDSTHRRTAKYDGLQSGSSSPYPIHPVFRKECWILPKPSDYKRLDTALKLALRILDDPDTLPFFKGILERDQMVELSGISKMKAMKYLSPGEKLQRFQALPIENDGERTKTWKALAKMAGSHTWSFGDTPKAAGITRRDKKKRGLYKQFVRPYIA